MNRWIEFVLILMSGIIGGLLANDGTGKSYFLISPVIIIIICEILIEHDKMNDRKTLKKNSEDKEDDTIDLLINNLNINMNIEHCQVCGRKIKPNENGTCDECHQEIMRRLETKNKK